MIGELSNTASDSLSSAYSSRRSKLQGIDGAVKAHEKAHLLALGGHARGGISYDYIITPDGQRYAVGGSVGVDMKPVPGNPQATIRKMRSIRAAALSPNHPSAADSDVAAKTIRIEMQARQKLEHSREQGPENTGAITDSPIPAEVISPTPFQETAGNYTLTGTDIPELIDREEKTPTISESKLYFSGSPEMIIENAKDIRRSIRQTDFSSAKNRQLLARTYAMEMRAQQKIEEREQNNSRVDVLV